ncbi:MAG: transcription-repair coupling factor, partial [Chloroflexi bacterium]|nr:transcription-repair coupling factor [Chloroflexota bacterium]
TKRRAREAVEILAKDLIALYAARSQRDGHAFGPDSAWEQEMESAFVYEETPDQLRAIRDVKEDLESDRPMDRLVCGDVGYGKTEVAIRAAFKVVMNGKQVAILVPTTVLAQQHFNTFTERLSGFPVKVETLSRFRTRREQAAVVEGLKDGSVDIVIGTHRLLSKDVGFKDLGLVVVDEEQRFGVAHKEKLKQLRQMVDVLTLTATPIPRTLHMAISTIRDMSVMNQAPEGRTPIRTYLREYSDDLVKQCILRELERDGQAYFVHNRVESLPHLAETVRKLVPQARVGMAHGQMPEQQLEQVMLDFYERQYDVLCCTTIIESGLDIPNVNTICIDNADRLGLAQLYQLRGRVGRSNRQAYCFLLFKPDKELTELAQKRLQALREFSDLGSGFRIAMRDLEIRGAGNLLGAEQSGALSTVGFDLYCQMIADAVRTLRNDPPPPPPLPPVDLPIAAYLPAEYIPAESLRVEFYKRLSSPTSAEEIVAIQEEMQDRPGHPRRQGNAGPRR